MAWDASRIMDPETAVQRVENNKFENGHQTLELSTQVIAWADWKTPSAVPRGGSAKRIKQKESDQKRGPQVNLEDQVDAWPKEAGNWSTPTQGQGGGYYGNGAEKLDRQAQNWPTALTTDLSGHGYQRCPDGTIGETLAGAAKDWATPNASEMIKSGASDAMAEKKLLGGQAAAWPKEREDWATATAADGDRETVHIGRNDSLPSQAKSWPMNEEIPLPNRQATLWPEERDQSSPQPVTIGTLGKKLREMGIRYRLNPRFAEWLMGLPPDWVSRDPNNSD